TSSPSPGRAELRPGLSPPPATCPLPCATPWPVPPADRPCRSLLMWLPPLRPCPTWLSPANRSRFFASLHGWLPAPVPQGPPSGGLILDRLDDSPLPIR